MAGFDTWESYFYPDTYDGETGTLRNLFDERDPDVLRGLEYGATFRRQHELERGDVTIPRTFDAAHVRAIHAWLFQDVYEWAGEYRGVNMTKGVSDFADLYSHQIDRYLADMSRIITATDWARSDHDQFATRMADVFAYLNQAHPFREGNGRTSKVFLEHVAEQSPWTLHYDRVSPVVWNAASALSGPNRWSYQPVSEALVPVFEVITGPRLGWQPPEASRDPRDLGPRPHHPTPAPARDDPPASHLELPEPEIDF